LTNADLIIAALRGAGVRRLIGMPGGGSTADLIEAARRAGLPFTLAHTETGSAFIAAAEAEIAGTPAVCVATLGPGAASLANGVAHALLDRVPLLLLTDCLPEDMQRVADHQNFAHDGMFAPITKATLRARAADAGRVLCEAIAVATGGRPGPVHVDISPDVTGSLAADTHPCEPSAHSPDRSASGSLSERALDFIRCARRPVFLLGLGARTRAIASAVRSIAASHHVPALVTYKGKGIVADADPWFAGVITNGALERPVLEAADLFLAVGFDPVELLPRRWELEQPVISIAPWPVPQQHVPIADEAVGDVAALLDSVRGRLRQPSDWTRGEIGELVERQRKAMRAPGEGGLLPHEVVDAVAEFYAGSRVTVDAGAHMFPVLALWPATVPSGLLISNGLATMGFALPAAIGAALTDPSEPVVAFTGDGGLLMCLGELRTAVREKVAVRIIVFDDRALSLIRIKQLQRGYATDGTGLGAVDWRAVATGLGLVAHHVETADALRRSLAATAREPGPVLIAAAVSPATYPEMMRALRG
jgi:acetolactate synthase-1/2/3 large subunit